MKARVNNQNDIEFFTKEQLSGFPKETRQQIIQKSGEISKRMTKAVENAFVLGTKSISKIAIKDYKPEIDAAKDYDTIRVAVDKLFTFLGKGDDLR